MDKRKTKAPKRTESPTSQDDVSIEQELAQQDPAVGTNDLQIEHDRRMRERGTGNIASREELHKLLAKKGLRAKEDPKTKASNQRGNAFDDITEEEYQAWADEL